MSTQPWNVALVDTDYGIGYIVAPVERSRVEADNRRALIAAAPDLLAALRAFVDGAQIGPETHYKERERIEAARAALAKAVQS
ncbi:MAG: hypothetical protein KGL39_07245 [Patescibacteria group bacterium]|nr:hypothetical protein [Patescibacteria group bacterium]